MKKILIVLVLFFGLIMFTGCNEADNVQYNISQKSDNFETYRVVTVVNLRSDKVLLQVEGFISIKDSTEDELAIIIRTGKNEYKMHYVYLGSEVVYLVEQKEASNTDPYHWEIRLFAVFPDIDAGRQE